MPTAAPDQILEDLSKLWAQLDADPASKGGVLRACAMTLVAVAENSPDAEQARQTIGAIMHEHPSRAIILKMADGGADEVGARVFAECWMPFGSDQQICSEGIELTAAPRHFGEAASLLTPLRVADLPLVLWCRGPGAFSLRAFDALFAGADKLIFDSSTVPGASAALGFLRGLRERGFRVADLHWTRLTGWREALSHLFDDEAVRPGDVSSVRIAHGGATPSTCALYFASWIGQALPSAHIVFETGGGKPGLRAVRFSTPKGQLSLTREGSSLEVSGAGRNYRAALPKTDEAALMREELRILGRDPVYDQVLG